MKDAALDAGVRAAAAVLFLLWGWRAAREDLATKRIPNRRVLQGFALCGALLAWELALTGLGNAGRVERFLLWNFYGDFARHLSLCVVGGLTLWVGGVWPAGDAKLFMACAALLPLLRPDLRLFPHSLFLGILVNIFIPAAVVLFTAGLRHRATAPSDGTSLLFRAGKAFAAWRAAAPETLKQVPAYAVNLAAIFLVQALLSEAMSGGLARVLRRPTLLYFLLFFLWERASVWLRDRRAARASLVLLAVYLLSAWLREPRLLGVLGLSLVRMLEFSLFFFLGRVVISAILEGRATRWIMPEDLRPGMVLTPRQLDILRSDEDFFAEHFEPLFVEGVTEEQAAALRQWMATHPVKDARVEVSEGEPFGLWIVVGSALTLLLGGDLIGPLRRLLGGA
ncbi:MAG: hypothetical protein WC969_13520 [Elusimicrobiota bacterium]